MIKSKLMCEMVNGEPYEYYPLGEYIVSAPEVCGGHPTFKYIRIEVAGVIDLVASGEPIQRIVKGYQGRVSQAAIDEALMLAAEALVAQTEAMRAKT
ncbi:DUF433 domain-containing protein [Candidatus Poribacteria bacterium]|nr:DUF433 domain-containing protein [Candidatus Poribacteria bacterium]